MATDRRSNRLLAATAAAALLGAGLAAPALTHELDHPTPTFVPSSQPAATGFISGDGDWSLLATITTGNPHSDLDFFTQDGERYVSVGTLAFGPNAGGQTIVQLTQDGRIAPRFVAGHGSASCINLTSSATGLQHDVEATPKGDVLFNTNYPNADRRDAQLLIDSTDSEERCHDNGTAGAAGKPPHGGFEVIDITDVSNPKEIALISIWEDTHTLNVDPKRPHIAFHAGQDEVSIPDRPDADNPNGSETSIDGFHLVDLSSCMDFPAGTSIDDKRAACRPEVYRYRFAGEDWARGTWDDQVSQGCHEVEIYPDDKLACASIDGTVLLDLSGAFDDNGTPDDFTDDVPRGTPLPCRVRQSSSLLTPTAAPIVDCSQGEVDGTVTPLSASNWLKMGAPSLEGVELIGFVNHGGGLKVLEGGVPPFSVTEDVFASHEAELTHSGKFLIVSDEAGGGVIPPFASCGIPNAQNPRGNGGLHVFAVDRLYTEYPEGTDWASRYPAVNDVYAKTPGGDRAIFRADVVVPQPSAFCTAHVFQQIPGQNRIFMGWYTQGTQVVDYVEHPDGTFEWIPVSYFVPENANQWTSHVFDMVENADGTFTYYGAAGDIHRTSIDVWSVTLPAPAQSPGTFEPVAPEPAPEPAPPAPEPEPAPLPATGASAVGSLLGLGLLNAGLLARRRRS